MKFVKQKKQQIILLLIIAFGAFLRLYGLNWDQGHHLHPDERAIVMFTTPLQFPKSLDEFLSPQSPWNPHFFAYGNFPLYLLKIVSLIAGNFDPSFALYDKINLVGRFISVLADLGTIIILFLLTKKIFNRNIALTASFFYAISVFPIQAAHFYAVDALLTFFIILTLYQLVLLYEHPSIKNSALSGVFFGLSLATKISAIPLIAAILAIITADFVLLFVKQPHKPHIWFTHIPHFLKRLIFDGVTITISTIITFATLQPYAIIDFQEFLKQNLLQSQMTRDPFTFPYTLQYVGKIPYWHELKNIFLWGQGPILAILSSLGTLYLSLKVLVDIYSSSEERSDESRSFSSRLARTIIVLCFFWVYFFVVGKFAVGWMRYMLPLYPLLALFAAISFLRILRLLPINFRKLFAICYLLFAILWHFSFMHIYTQPNTRVLASEWIYQNIAPNKIIAREHWDDGMPLGGNIAYKTLELPIYGMEDPLTKNQIYQTVKEADYIIIASNRLYVPLQRLYENCQKWKLPQERCSKNANKYYEELFSGKLGYKKVAEFANPPTIPLLNISINDQNADESFTVYDHPKVMIFKKISL